MVKLFKLGRPARPLVDICPAFMEMPGCSALPRVLQRTASLMHRKSRAGRLDCLPWGSTLHTLGKRRGARPSRVLTAKRAPNAAGSSPYRASSSGCHLPGTWTAATGQQPAAQPPAQPSPPEAATCAGARGRRRQHSKNATPSTGVRHLLHGIINIGGSVLGRWGAQSKEPVPPGLPSRSPGVLRPDPCHYPHSIGGLQRRRGPEVAECDLQKCSFSSLELSAALSLGYSYSCLFACEICSTSPRTGTVGSSMLLCCC